MNANTEISIVDNLSDKIAIVMNTLDKRNI